MHVKHINNFYDSSSLMQNWEVALQPKTPSPLARKHEPNYTTTGKSTFKPQPLSPDS